MALKRKEWDQRAFAALQAAWPPDRVSEDRKTLRKIFRAAAQSPTLAAEIRWARKHGVKFFIDHQAQNCGGYYWAGTGVVAIGAGNAGSAFGLKALGHELRHAWQDYHGLLAWNSGDPGKGSFNDFFINVALIEADAFAYGNRVADEIRAAERKELGMMIPLSLKNSLADEKADLGEKFLRWFDEPSHPRNYGDFFSKKFGQKRGYYYGTLLDYNFEHKPVAEPDQPGVDIRDRQAVLRLGENFEGRENYLAHLQPDILLKKVLRPSLADTFWGAANYHQKKLAQALRKAHLKEKFAPERINGKLVATKHGPRHKWP